MGRQNDISTTITTAIGQLQKKLSFPCHVPYVRTTSLCESTCNVVRVNEVCHTCFVGVKSLTHHGQENNQCQQAYYNENSNQYANQNAIERGVSCKEQVTWNRTKQITHYKQTLLFSCAITLVQET